MWPFCRRPLLASLRTSALRRGAALQLLAVALGVVPVLAAAAPRRVVSLNVMTDQWLLRIGSREQVASLTWLSRDPAYNPLWREAASYPVGYGTTEEVLRHNPDLVLAGRWGAMATQEMLRRFGARLVVLDYPADFDGIAAQAEEIGRLLGQESRAEAYVSNLRERLGRVRARRPAEPLRVLEYGQNGWTHGAGTVLDLLLRECGHRNLAAERGVSWLGQISLEELVMMRPDRLVLPGRPDASPALAYGVFEHPALRAALSGRVALVLPEGTSDFGGPFTIDALEYLSEHLALSGQP